MNSLPTSKIRFLALDLDGTLLRSDKSISPRTRSALQSAESQGYIPIIATARPPRSTATLLDGFLPSAPRIYYSGSRICIGNECILNRTIPIEAARATVDLLLSRSPQSTISVEIDDRLFSNHPHKLALPGDVTDLHRILDRDPVKIMLDLTLPDLPQDILSDLPPAVRYVISDGGSLAQIMNASVSKSDAVRRVVEREGADLSAVIAFGDDTNDIEMIRDTGIGVAMANAVDSVKSAADHITASNDEDGVALAIEELLLR